MAIVEGRYAPGDLIARSDQAAGLGSDPVTLRALGALEILGLVSRGPGGATVNPECRWNSLDPRVVDWRMRSGNAACQVHWLAQVRSAVEPMAAALAAQNATSEQVTALAEYCARMEDSADDRNSPKFLELDAAYHQTLLEASGNPMFASFAPFVAASLKTGETRGHMPMDVDRRIMRMHAEAAAAVAQGDAAGAEMAIRIITGKSEASALARVCGEDTHSDPSAP
ncbi:MAG: FCD domain-containing protein [Bifidobacteriaceae bacterium]|nr:FCD domain-containing protein [Bifidobacteriaceae bacterium]